MVPEPGKDLWLFCQCKGGHIKRSLTRDFRLKVFFINQCPPGPWVSQRAILNFFEIRWDIREWMFISGVNDTGEKRDKFWEKFFFSYFVKSLVYCTLHLKIEFLVICDRYQRHRGNETGINCSPVSTTPSINFSAVSATPANRESCQY